MLVIAAGLLAVVYGAAQSAALLRASPGNAKMQEIAAAIQEGAQAYLRRQYMTIAMVGVVILLIVGFLIGRSRPPASWSARCCPARPASPAC